MSIQPSDYPMKTGTPQPSKHQQIIPKSYGEQFYWALKGADVNLPKLPLEKADKKA